jgi:predicted metal-dependent hydrolase
MNYQGQNLSDLNVKYASFQESLNRLRDISSRVKDKIKTSELTIFYQRINDLLEDCITDQLKLTRIPKFDESEIKTSALDIRFYDPILSGRYC